MTIRTTVEHLKGCVAVVGLVVGCLGANLVFAGGAVAKECKLTRLGSADLVIRDDLLIVPVTLNSHPANMELDTSNALTVITSGDLQPFDLRAYPSDDVTVNFRGTLINQIAQARQFAVGSYKFAKLDLWVLPGSAPPSATNMPDIGRLGMNVLATADFELDFANNKLNFYSQEHCPGAVVYWTDNYSSARISRGPLGNYYFPIELEGRTVQASISTGVANTTISTDVTRRLYGFDETSKDIEIETDSAGHPVAYYRAMTVAGDGINIKNAKIRLDPRAQRPSCAMRNGVDVPPYGRCESSEPTLFLGLNVARRLHLYFATKERVLYFSDVAASK